MWTFSHNGFIVDGMPKSADWFEPIDSNLELSEYEYKAEDDLEMDISLPTYHIV